MGANLSSKGQGHWERKCKTLFSALSKMDWFYIKPRSKWSAFSSPFYACCRIHFTSGNASFLWCLSVTCVSHTFHSLSFGMW